MPFEVTAAECTAPLAEQRLTVEEIGLLRRAVRWRRANGWRFERNYSIDYLLWAGPGGNVEVDLLHSAARVIVETDARRVADLWPRSVRQAVDLLVALGVLPVEMSSAYEAGRQSVPPMVEQWRLSNGHVGRDRSASREEAEAKLAEFRGHSGEFWVERRLFGATEWERVGPWTEVA